MPRAISCSCWRHGQIVLQHDKQLLQLNGDRHQRREDHHERAILLALGDLGGQSLDDLRALQEAVEVDQHQQRGTVRRAQRIQRTNGGQRIVGARVDAGIILAVDRQAAVDVPDDQPPVLGAAHLGDFGQGVFVLVGLNPQAGETGGDVLRQVLGKLHAKDSGKRR